MTAFKLNSKTILILSGEGTHRENLRKAMHMEDFVANYVSSSTEVTDLLNAIKPGVFVHDWSAVDESQSRRLQQRISKIAEYSEMCRVLLVPAITPQILALANDAAINKVILLSTPAIGVVSHIKMALSAQTSASELQKKIHEIRSGNAEYKQEDIDKTVEEAFKKFPHDVDVRLEFGNLLFRRDDLKKARQLGEDILTKEPGNVRAMNLVARISMKWGRFHEAIQILGQADALSPDNPTRLLMLGDAFYGNGDLAQAEKCYNKVTELDPDNKDAQSTLGQIKLSQGDAESALALFRNSISEEEAAGFFNNAGVAAVKANNISEGLRLYETALKALKTTRNRPQILFNMALAYKRIGQADMAIKMLRRALKLQPTFEKATKLLNALEDEMKV